VARVMVERVAFLLSAIARSPPGRCAGSQAAIVIGAVAGSDAWESIYHQRCDKGGGGGGTRPSPTASNVRQIKSRLLHTGRG